MLSVVEPLLPTSEHNLIKFFGVNNDNIDVISDKIKRINANIGENYGKKYVEN